MGFFNQLRSIFGKGRPAEAPVEPVSKPPNDETPEERRLSIRINPRKGTRVLVVDDSPTILAVFRKVLTSAGCEVLEALDGESGVATARAEVPELIFLDIMMPGMNGFAALRILRRDPLTRQIPIIIISGNEQATEQYYANRIGADDFMKKPFSRSEVFTRIERLLDSELIPRRVAGGQ